VLYRHYFPIMYRIVKKMVADKHDLISIINDGFLKVFQHLDKYKSENGIFDAWLYTIVVNSTYDHIRKSKRGIQTTEITNQVDFSDNSHLYVVSPEEVSHLILRLPNITGKVLSLSVDGYTHKEIAESLGITEVSSRWHLSEARRKIRAIIQLERKMA
jgi:RNA polymerase sigma factor (sigma-70 family)